MAVAQAPEAQCVRLIPLTEVMRLTGRGRSRIYAAMRTTPPTFPQPIKDGASTRWVEHEVLAFIADRIAARDKAAA